MGWHLGHIAFTEALWILEHLAGQPNPLAEHRLLFAADGLPKSAREQVPDLTTTLELPKPGAATGLGLPGNGSPARPTASLVVAAAARKSAPGNSHDCGGPLHRQQAGRYLLSEPAINGHPQNGNRPALPASEVPKTPMAFMPGADIRVRLRRGGLPSITNSHPLIVQVKPFLYGCASRHPGAISRFYGGWRLSYSRSVVLPGMGPGAARRMWTVLFTGRMISP